MRVATRLGIVFGVGSLIAVATVGSLAWLLAEDEVIDAADRELAERAELLATLTERAREQDQIPDELPAGGPGADVLIDGIEAYDSAGALLVGELGLLGPEDVAALDDGEPQGPTDLRVDDREYRVVVAAVPGDVATPLEDVSAVVLYEDVTTQRRALDRLQRRIALAAAVAFVALTAAGWFVGRRLAKPLSGLADAATELASLERVPERIQIERNDEVGQLAMSFNRLIAALEIAREQQQRLVADASHELRTPLTSLRTRIEFLASTDDLDDLQRQALLDDAVGDLAQLTALVGELVDLAADIRGGEEAPELRALAPILVEVSERVSSAQGRDIEVVADDSAAMVRPGMIRRAVQNLVDNAVKYSPAGTTITVRLRGGAIEVADEGPGIPEHERALVFDRFYRSPQARKRPGNGIGLAIVQQVADVHGGRTWVGSAPGGGACVGFSVPLA